MGEVAFFNVVRERLSAVLVVYDCSLGVQSDTQRHGGGTGY